MKCLSLQRLLWLSALLAAAVFGLAAAVLGLVACSGSPVPKAQAANAQLAFNPSSPSVAVGGNIAVDITVANVSNLGGYDVHLQFDPAVIHVASLTDAGFVTGGGNIVVCNDATIDNSAGTATTACATFSFFGTPGPGVSTVGATALLHVSFTGVSVDTSPLTLTGTTLENPNGAPIAAKLGSGSITVAPTVSGTYSMLLTLQDGTPGFYENCIGGIQQSGKNLTAKILCYVDSPGSTVNPQVAAGSATMGVSSCPPASPKYCGDGLAGAPPPGCVLGASCIPLAPNCPSLPCDVSQYQFADIDSNHTVLTGTLDNTSDTMNLSGCFQDLDGFAQLSNVYVQAQVNANTGQGTANMYTSQTTGDCTAGTPSGSPIGASIAAALQAPGSDSDADGCPDQKELSDTQASGGLRDPYNRWDFFNPEKASTPNTQTVADILKVIQQFGKNQGNAAYTIDTDRTGLIGGNAWNLGPPDGQQTVADILAAIKQFNQGCTP